MSELKLRKSYLAFVAFVMATTFDGYSWSQPMPATQSHVDEKRLEFAKGVIHDYGDKIDPKVR